VDGSPHFHQNCSDHRWRIESCAYLIVRQSEEHCTDPNLTNDIELGEIFPGSPGTHYPLAMKWISTCKTFGCPFCLGEPSGMSLKCWPKETSRPARILSNGELEWLCM
jgi:hypothetical protein